MSGAANQQRAGRRAIPTNVSLDPELVAEARELGVNISRASAVGVKEAVAKARAERWLLDNQLALESSNRFAENHGLPLRALRQF